MEGVGAIINRAERALRPAMIVRKLGGCNKIKAGACAHAMLSSLSVTLKQQGREALDYLGLILTSLGGPPNLLSAPAGVPP